MVVYVVTMYRYGDREKHSYVTGVFSDKAQAIKWGVDEEIFRGGKYKPEVVGFVLDAPSIDPEKIDLKGE